MDSPATPLLLLLEHEAIQRQEPHGSGSEGTKPQLADLTSPFCLSDCASACVLVSPLDLSAPLALGTSIPHLQRALVFDSKSSETTEEGARGRDRVGAAGLGPLGKEKGGVTLFLSYGREE